MTNIFVQPPFSTEVGARVEAATRGTLSESNWQLNMEIIDRINSNPQTSKDFLRAIKKRLQSKKASQHEISLALVLLESVSKNCGERLQLLISQKEFCREVLYGVVSTRRGKQVCEQHIEDKVLLIIDNIATHLEEHGRLYSDNGKLNAIIELKRELKAKGVDFPSERGITDEKIVEANSANAPKMSSVSSGGVIVQGNEAAWRSKQAGASSRQPYPPIYQMDHTQIPVHQSIPSQAPSSSQNIPSPISTEQESSKIRADMKHVTNNVNMLNELIEQFGEANKLGPNLENDDKLLLKDLKDTIQEMQQRIVELIPNLSDDMLMIEMVDINDNVLASLKLYDEFMDGEYKTKNEMKRQYSSIGQEGKIEVSEQKSVDNLISFGDDSSVSQQIINAAAGPGPSSQELMNTGTVPAPATSTQYNDDPFGLGNIDFGLSTTTQPSLPPVNQATLPPITGPTTNDDFFSSMQLQQQPVIPAIPARQPIGTNALVPSYEIQQQQNVKQQALVPTSDLGIGNLNQDLANLNLQPVNQNSPPKAITSGSSPFANSNYIPPIADPNEFSEFSPFTASESGNNLALKSTAQTGNAFDDWLNATPLTSGNQNTGVSSKNSQNLNLTNTNTTVNKEILDFPTGSTINSQFPVSNSANNVIKDNNDLNLDFSSNPVNQRLNAEFSEFLTSPQAFDQNQNDKK